MKLAPSMNAFKSKLHIIHSYYAYERYFSIFKNLFLVMLLNIVLSIMSSTLYYLVSEMCTKLKQSLNVNKACENL